MTGVQLGMLAMASNRATSSQTSNVSDLSQLRTNWIDSIIGTFDGNPVYARIMRNVQENRRRLEEQLTLE